MPETKVSLFFKEALEVCGKTQAQVAEEVGYPKPNIISMFKNGDTRIPLEKAGDLALAVNVDPVHFVRLLLESYTPLTYGLMSRHLGELVSANELAILRVIREASDNSDPALKSFSKGMIEALFRGPAP